MKPISQEELKRRTVQAAPSDRERQYMEPLAVYANDEDRYNRGDGEPYGSIPVEVGAIARQARAALAAAPDKPQYAVLSPEPWGGPEGEEE